MKLTKREQQAISTMREILDAIENDQILDIAAKDYNAIKDCLGIDLKEVTKKKKEVGRLKRGKTKFHLIFSKPFAQWSEFNKVKRYGFFSFQIAEKTQ